MYRIVLCDDNGDYLNIVKGQVKNYCMKKNIRIELETFQDSSRLEEAVEKGKLFDACILDIDMPFCSGIDIADLVRDRCANVFVIFLTAYHNFAEKACRVNVIRYVLKDKMEQELEGALDELFFRLERLECQKNYIISNNRKYIKILQKDIIYIRKVQKDVVFVLNDGKEEKERTTLQDVYRKLENPEIVWLDRGIILNLRHVRKISGDQIEMNGGYIITTNTEHLMELKRHLALYWGGMV